MTRGLVVAVVFCGGLVACRDKPQPVRSDGAPVPYVSQAGAFTASFPIAPTPEHVSRASSGIEMHVVSAELDAGQRVHMITWADLPDGRPPDEVAQAICARLATEKGRTLVSRAPFALAGNPGCDLELDDASGSHFWMRIVVAKRRLYQVITTARVAQTATSAAKAFAGSFALAP